MNSAIHTSVRDRRDWTCPSCGGLIEDSDRFRFLVEYQRYMETPAGLLEGVGTERPRLACRTCQTLADRLPAAPRRLGGSWAIWIAIALLPLTAGVFILGLIASWMAG